MSNAPQFGLPLEGIPFDILVGWAIANGDVRLALAATVAKTSRVTCGDVVIVVEGYNRFLASVKIAAQFRQTILPDVHDDMYRLAREEAKLKQEESGGMNRLIRYKASFYRGVVYRKRYKNLPWLAKISHLGNAIEIGGFATQEEAARAYDAKAIELKGDRAILNFPRGA